MAAIQDAGWPVIAVNNAAGLCDRAAALYACDLAWWRRYRDVWGNHPADPDLWTMDPEAADRFGLHHVVSTGPGPELPADATEIAHGWSGGFQALQLALRWGARRVILLGIDCGPDARGARHWHLDHDAGLSNPVAETFAAWEKAFDGLAPTLKGVNVVNVGTLARLRAFPIVPLEDALA